MSVHYGFTIEIYGFANSLQILQRIFPLFYACAHDGRLFGGLMMTAGQRTNVEIQKTVECSTEG